MKPEPSSPTSLLWAGAALHGGQRGRMISLCAFPWELHLSDPVRSENLRYSASFSWAFSFYHGHKSETLGLGRNVNSWKQSFTQGGAVSFKIHPHLLASENFEHFIPQL